MPDKEKRKAVYDAVSKDYDLGSYDEFSNKMEDSTKRKAFYNDVGKEYDLGDYNSFETNISVKKKDSGNVSPTGLSTTTTTTSEPKPFVQGSAPVPKENLIQMPGEKTDDTVHENDPVKTAIQPHRNEYIKTLNEYNNSGVAQRQSSESTAQKIKPQQMLVGGNGSYGATLKGKLDKHAEGIENTYDAVINQVLPNVDAAKDFLQKTAEKNKGQLPEDNETAHIAVQKINDYNDREKTIAESGDLTSAAVNQAMKENPTLAKQIETIKKEHPDAKSYKEFLPGSMVGKLVDNFYKDKDNQDVINHHPEWKEQFENLGKNNLTDNPEYGAVVVGNELSRARQQEGKNNPVLNVAFSGHSKYMDELANKLYKDDPQKLKIYNDIVRNDYNKYIDTKDFVSGVGEGAKGVFKGIKNTFKELTGQGSDAEAAQEHLREQNEQISSGAKGIYEYTDPAGKFLGMVGAMAATGGVLKGVGIGEKIANGANVATTFWGDEKQKARLKFPGEKLKQNSVATLMTGAYLFAPNAVPSSKISKFISGIRPEMESISDQLINGILTKNAAKDKALYAFEQALKFGKAAGKQNLAGAGEMTAITAFSQFLDKAHGLSDANMKEFHQEGELQDVAKSMLIGNAIPSLLMGAAGIKARPYTKESLYEMATNPKRFQSVLHDQMLTDPNAHANIDAKIQDLDHLVRTKSELDAHTELSTDQKKQYILQDYNEKILRYKAETVTNPFIKSKLEDQIKKAAEIKENIFKGKGTDMLPQEDHLTSKEYKEVSDIKTDEDLFNYFVGQKKEGYKTTLKAAEDMEDKQAGVKAGVDYMKDKAIENPALFRERWGNDITNKMLDKATIQEIGDSYHNLIDVNSKDPAIPILEKILDEREAKGEVYKPKETEDNSNTEVDESLEPAEVKNKFPIPKKDVTDMTSEELNQYAQDVKKHGKNLEAELFGEEGRKNITPQMEEGLSEKQKEAYFGKNLPENGVYDYTEIRRIENRVKGIEESESAKEISEWIKRPLIDFARKNDSENLAVIKAAARKAEELGIPANELIKESVKRVGGEFKDKDEAQGIIEKILNSISKPTKNNQNAIPERSTTSPTVGETPSNSSEVGARIPESKEPPGARLTVEEGQGEGKKVTGIKNAISNETRGERQLPKVEVPEYGNDSKVIQEGKELVDSGKINPREVVNRILSTKGGMHAEDAKAMQYYMHQLASHEKDLRTQYEQADTPEGKAEVSGKLQQLGDEMDAATQSNIIAGKSWSDVGNIRQIQIDEGFNPSREKAIIKDAYGGEMPKDVEQKINGITKERDEALAQLNKVEEQLREKMAKQATENIKKDAVKQSKRQQKKEELKKEEEDLLKELKKSIKKDMNNLHGGIPIPKETLETISKLLLNYAKQGVHSLEGLVDKLHTVLKDDVEGITKKQVRDLVVQYQETDKLNKKAERKQNELRPTIVDSKGKPREPKDFAKTEIPKEKLKFRENNEWVKANQRVADAEFKLKVEKRKAYESQKNFYQRALMWVGRVVRLSVLSGYNVLGKLAAAATIGGAGKRIPEQMIGGIYSTVFKGIAEKAPIEGYLNANAEARFYREFFHWRFFTNALQILKTGESDLSKRFGGGQYEHVPIMYLPTDLHQIIKDPVKRATFQASFKNGMVWAEKNGLDINDPLVIHSLETAAYKRANYEIFQEQNWLSRKFTAWKNQMEKSGNVGATGKFLAEFMIPVSTVPTNIVRRLVTTSPLGLIRGGKDVVNAYRKGIENLKPDEADAVMKQLKQGSLGTALWLIGWFGSGYFGGLYSKYNPDKKRKEGELAHDEMSIDGKMIPKPVQHALPLEVIQWAATARHIYDNYRERKKESNFQSIYSAGLGSVGALAEQIPVVETGAHVIGSFHDPYEGEKLKEDVSRRFKPQILRETGIIPKDEKKKKK